MLNSDNWLEIMRHLDISLPPLALTSKQLYIFYQQHKKLLCNEGNYRFSSYQHQLVKDMNNYRTKPLLIQTNNNIGTKAAILSAAFKYKGTTVIITSKKENANWAKEIKKLYYDNHKILICADHYCDRRLVQFGYTHDFDLMTYKIIIANHGNFDQISKHSMLIFYKYDKVISPTSNTILFSGKVKTAASRASMTDPICDYIEYPFIKPMMMVKDICCYHDNPKELLLSPQEDDYLYKTLNERLDHVINHIIHYYEGPYLILGDDIMTSHPLKNKAIRPHDIIFISYKKFIKVDNIKTVILLWPGHLTTAQYKNVVTILNQLNVYRLNIFNIHSTIEEKYLLYLDKSIINGFKLTNRKKIDFLSSVRTLMRYNLDNLPHHYFSLLMYAADSELPKVYQMIYTYYL